MIKSYKDIIVWKKAHELTLLVYRLTEKYPKTELFGLVSQSRRCAVSVPSNLVEGFKRKGPKDAIHFYNISQGSLEELRYQMLLVRDLGYISSHEYQELELLADEVAKLLYSWIKNQK